MLLKLDDIKIRLDKVDVDKSIISKYSGNVLEKFSVDINIMGNLFDHFKEMLDNSKEGGVFTSTNDEPIIKEYKLINQSHSYSGNHTDANTLYTFTLHFEEVERLNIEKLIIAGIETTPYKYSEDFDDGLIITANIRVPKTDIKKLEEATQKTTYFEVVRKGISDEVKIMRFGKIYWSVDGDFEKQHLTLAEESYDKKDESMKPKFLEPSIVQRELIHLMSLNDGLIDLLIANNIITSEQLKLIKQNAVNNKDKYYKQLFRVMDIDEFF